ncbi:CDP-alcohol phosphatidyltransferase [Thermocrinis albus DSM 14484]|uniref:CDP-alcohol phosphatidyltransferase n=1 Tax=Thermocrinis albus (strain DSM 14484 / JCM 11386 / HI 11/12) TaxID=638303 RepID=D3SPR8_THEAH|nr:CDP-alcohol phosphatidyltransferase family protein [Thermocrinis albus]ADC89155.1 CDP-alcohol phosphatidyltransferase [Thermocrinis albus DSM 14484]
MRATMSIPNLVSITRLLLSPTLLLLDENLFGFFFVLLALTDALDGYWARKYHAETQLGRLLDPLADRILTWVGVGACSFKFGLLPHWFFYLLFLRDVSVLLGGLHITFLKGTVPQARLLGKVSTLFLSLLVPSVTFLKGTGPYVLALTFLAVVASWADYSFFWIRQTIPPLDSREYHRKILHLFGLSLWLLPVLFFNEKVTLLLMVTVLLANGLILLRWQEKKLRFLYQLIYSVERDKNREKPGVQAFWAHLGILVSFVMWGKCSAVGITLLAVGDAFSSLVGMYRGKLIWKDKSWEGSVAFFLSSFLVLTPFVGWEKAFIFSVVGALTELLLDKPDDNFTLPLVGGLLCYML